ncbi:spore cortex biosynthesis protein YabQ [Petroclostridium sp. X23]|uniref:spore cortex biosynthesis protein YabQ n=1 Tax=Petroclostridium sp. X23 TaxID=3045146 RepID=UPI0024AD4E89|nr:spore cortex biosynthesis protein YabQ [Petroclostridium sp. X23]WHH57615.1 spore cortex biosynthesis protein YabQ [Petroclostridium sp. X23]
MEVSITNQAYVFLSSVVGGLVVGFVFDIFRILRRVVKTANFITYLEDILFWILVTIIIFTLVFVTNNGELRWFEFLGVILGVIFYNLLLSAYIIGISVSVINVIKKIIVFIVKVLLFPFAIIYKIFRRPCAMLGRFIRKILKKLRRIFKNSVGEALGAFKNIRKVLKKV